MLFTIRSENKRFPHLDMQGEKFKMVNRCLYGNNLNNLNNFLEVPLYSVAFIKNDLLYTTTDNKHVRDKSVHRELPGVV